MPMMRIAFTTYFHQISTFHPFPLNLYISPYFQKITFFPNLRFLLPPYFDHDAFMHHALYILDAPG